MSGRKPVSARIYDVQGTFIESLPSLSEVRKKYYPEIKGKKLIFIHTITFYSTYHEKNITVKYRKINDELYVFDQAIYRNDVVYLDKIINSPYCNIVENKPVEVYNLQNVKIAEFASPTMVFKCMPQIPDSVIYNQLNRSESSPASSYKELIFKYKK